jgi:predicted NBD/HSP70 family sugar kinase
VLAPAWEFLQRPARELRQRAVAPWDRVVVGVPAPFQRGVGLPPARRPVPTTQARAGSYAGAAYSESRGDFAPWLRPDPAAALASRLGVPVVIENDANLGALGEAHAGAGRGHDCLIYLKLGERSVGAGLVLDGSLYRGVSGFAGELAHLHVDDEGPLCACGARGCLAARARGPLLELMQCAYDRPLTFAEVLRLAEADEPAPVRVLREVGRTLGRPLADLCTFLNPGALVLDGALGPAGRHVLTGLAEQIESCCAPAVAASLELLPGELGADADVHGAIRLARAEALGPRPRR